MSQRIRASAPYIPEEATYFERADRDSEQMKKVVKPKNILAAIMGMGNPANQLVENKREPKRMDFDQAHYEKFEREVKKEQDEADPEGKPQAVARKRQNPLGDFKFRRINELF